MPGNLISKQASRLDASAVIPPERSQSAMHLAVQLTYQRFVRPGPLVLRTAFLKFPTRAADRDRTVSRRSEPSSRTALMGEPAQPLGPTPAPGCDEPTSRCQTMPSIWTLGQDQPVPSTRGPGRTNLWCASCPARGTAGWLRSGRVTAESI